MGGKKRTRAKFRPRPNELGTTKPIHEKLGDRIKGEYISGFPLRSVDGRTFVKVGNSLIPINEFIQKEQYYIKKYGGQIRPKERKP